MEIVSILKEKFHKTYNNIFKTLEGCYSSYNATSKERVQLPWRRNPCLLKCHATKTYMWVEV